MAAPTSISGISSGRGSTWSFFLQELRPKGKLLTPFNVISSSIMAATAVILYYRFAYGLGSVTNLNQDFPWGLWVGFDVITGVAFAGGAYVLTFLVYILRLEQYKPIVRVVVLNGFLAYTFYSIALLLDLGRPWKVINPIIGNSFGFSSVLFLVAWHFLLYITAEFLEFSPAIAEWLRWKRIHRVLTSLTVATVIFGISLSTLHQSGLGALFMMAKAKIHPLWYSEFIPLLFFVSSIFAGLAMVLVEGGISHRVFHHRLSSDLKKSHDRIMIGLARMAGGVMFVYLFLTALNFLHGQLWQHMAGGWGLWYMAEILGLVAVPMVLFIAGSAQKRTGMIRVAAILTLLGIGLNRLNISIIAFKWYAPVHYIPSIWEVIVTLGVISAEIWVFRWVVLRMPILSEKPAWARKQESPTSERPQRRKVAA